MAGRALGPAPGREDQDAAGLLGLEHGFFETQQGSTTPSGLVIHAIGSPCQPHTACHGCEPALTIIPSVAAIGMAAILLAAAVLIWPPPS